jgi:hypothetical protein
MNIIYRNSLSITFAILSLALSLILFNTAKKYLDLDQYIKLSIIIIFLVFFIINTFLKKNLQKKSFYLFIYVVLILYSLNTALGVYSIYLDNQKKNYIKNKSDEFDGRDIFQFIEDNKAEGKAILPYLTPREFLIKNENFMLVSAASNKNYAQCNESGNWKIIKTDDFGFNNNLIIDKYDILLAGDSFADGTCVAKNNEIANKLIANDFSTYTVGFAGNGPLLSLASIIEIAKYFEFRNLVWFIYRNDFLDLKWELSDKRLNKYFNPEFKGYDLFDNKGNIDNKYINFINSQSKKNINFELKESFLELKFLEKYFSLLNTSTESNKIDVKDFDKIFKSLVDRNITNNNQILIVYLPGYSCFTNEKKVCRNEFNKIKSSSEAQRIKSINFMNYIDKNNLPFKAFFSLEMKGNHYSNYGYDVLSSFVIKNLK